MMHTKLMKFHNKSWPKSMKVFVPLHSGHLLLEHSAIMAMVVGHWLSMLKWIPTGKNKWLWNSFRILSLWSGRLLEKEAALMAMVAGHWLPMLKWIPTRKNRWLWNSFGILSLWSGRLLEKEAALMAMDAGHWLPMLWCEPTAAGAEVLQWYQVNAPVLLTFSF